MSRLAVTWWGHSSTTIELGDLRIGTDPLFSRRLGHLRRRPPAPGSVAHDVDVVLVSHLHGDHLHRPSLRLVPSAVPLVVPRGAGHFVHDLGHPVVEVEPGDVVDVAGARLEVLPAHHDGRRHVLSHHAGPALGFRVEAGGRSAWYAGDTGPDPRMADVEPVDLAVVPIGGWGPTLGDEHLDPDEAAHAVTLVGARWAVPVHYGTYWPLGLQSVRRANHEHFFVTPAPRFAVAMARLAPEVGTVVLDHDERRQLEADA